jgi:16S rRNA (adenine1518-N6/adenine1519-N6)-dimethyltransferase
MAGRRLGQHFLARKSILERIAASACSAPDATVIEIGPGKGALTDYLVRQAARVVAIEVDPVLVHYLQEKFRGNENFSVIHADILKVDLAQWGPVSVAGNLPYYITSPIINKVLALGPLLLHAVFLVQREVAERIVAGPGSRDYGFLSVNVQTFAEPKILVHVPPEAFRPPPKVDSAVIELIPRRHPAIEDPPSFLKFASAAFKQKRKTLRNNLAALYGRPAIDAQPEAGKRAEQLSIAELANVHQRILKFQ